MTKNSYAQAGGRVEVRGKSYKKRVGSRREVWNETAYATNYGKDGLKKTDLIKRKGRIVSKKKSMRMKKEGLKRLRKAGWIYKKGKFGAVKIGSKSSTQKKRKRRRRKGKSRRR
mgnify:FL=1